MADPNFKKISAMTPIAAPATGDLLPIVDISEAADVDKNKTITYGQVRKDITTAEMLDAQVTGGKIAGATITAANLATDAVETLKIKGANVTYNKIQNVAGLSVLGNAAQAEASVQALAAGTDGHVMRRSGTGIGFGTIKPAGIDGLTTDPNDDRIVFWDDGEGALGYLTAGSGLQISGTTLNAAAISGTEIADDSVDSNHIAAGAVDLEHMSANSIDSDQYVDGSIDQEHLSVGASKVTDRQGGSATVSAVAGTTNYALSSARIQVGCISSSSTNEVMVTFPVAFATGTYPLVFITVIYNLSGAYYELGSITNTGFGITVYNADGIKLGRNVYWLAIGAA